VDALGINTPQLADGAVTGVKLAGDAVTSAQVVDGSLTADDLATGAVTEPKLDVLDEPTDGFVLGYNATSAQMEWVNPDASTSSVRWKTDVRPLENAVALVERLRGVRFRWKEDGRADIGVLAEEVAEVFPELVAYEDDGTTPRGVRYAHLTAVLIEVAKAQQSALSATEARIAAQDRQIDALTERLRRLEEALPRLSSPDVAE
jgi:hypothetical protein